jgi:pimeloyl-ACP methyl ester carboxylesterase
METLLPGITSERVATGRLTMAVLSVTGRTGAPVLFVHGNVSSSLFWQPTMLAVPDGYRPLAVDLRGFGETDPEPVDATRGLRNYADDLAAVLETLGLASVHLVGWSMGGGVLLQYLTDRPARRLRRGRRPVPRDGHRRLGSRAAPRPAGTVPGGAPRAPRGSVARFPGTSRDAVRRCRHICRGWCLGRA